MSRRVPAAPPPAGDPLRRVEQAARLVRGHGATVFLQPTVGHRRLVGPLVATLLALGVAVVLGLLAPLPGVALLLALAWSAVRDADGGRGWFRQLLPRRAGWVAEAELFGNEDPQQPTVIVWLPVVRYSAGLFLSARTARRLLLPLVAAGAVGALAVLLHAPFGVPGVELLVVACAAVFPLGALLAGSVLLGRRPQAAQDDATAVLSAALTDLETAPPPGVRILLLVGSAGATWFDDLGLWLRNRRHRYNVERTALIALQPARPPMGLVVRDGLLRTRTPPPALLDALAPCGLPAVEGRTAALRAAAHGLTAIGIQGPVWEQPDKLLAAVRCVASTLTAERA